MTIITCQSNVVFWGGKRKNVEERNQTPPPRLTPLSGAHIGTGDCNLQKKKSSENRTVSRKVFFFF